MAARKKSPTRKSKPKKKRQTIASLKKELASCQKALEYERTRPRWVDAGGGYYP